MKKIETAIFDVDGTLIDTRHYITEAYRHTLTKYGYETENLETDLKRLGGQPLLGSYAVLAPGSDFELLRESHGSFQKNNMHLISPYDGLHDVLNELKHKGIRVAACSSRGGPLKDSLKQVGILELFDSIVSGSDVTHHKPHPEGILKILELLNGTPECTAMIGDTVVDIEAGKAASLALTIGLTHGFGTRDMLVGAGADHVVDSLRGALTLMIAQ